MENAVTDALIGRLIDGRYQVISRISRGGMATVYRANDRRLDREVAVKVMHSHLAESEDFVTRFRREARAAARLSHPHVVQVFDQGFSNDSFYLTMEFVDGEDLRERLRREGALSVGDALDTTEAILDALATAHRRELVHRDIKPENVLLPKEGPLKVADFGLARAVSEATAVSTGTVLGTVAYLAPEIVTKAEATSASDIYATGVLLYEMLTGNQPFVGDLPIQVAFQHVNEDVPAPSEQLDWIPTEIDDLISAMTARDPQERIQDGGAALALVRRVRDGLDHGILTRRADVSGAVEEPPPHDATAPLTQPPSTGTVALPIGHLNLDVETASPDKAPRHRKAKRRRRPLLFTLLVLLMIGALTSTWYFFEGPGAYSPLPAVAGKTENVALDELIDAGFKPVVSRQNDDFVPSGEVISTTPTAQASVKRGSEVSVVVSQGIRQVVLPQMVGRPIDEVLEDLSVLRLAAPAVEEDYHGSVPANEVVSATLPEGEDAEPGASVAHNTVLTINVSKGREPVGTPDVVNQTKDAAVQALENAGLVVEYGDPQYTMEVEEGHVISQSPMRGEEQLYRGDKVTIVLSLGPPWVKVPEVIGLTEAEARQRIIDANLVPVREPGWFTVLDRVRKVSPNAGTEVRQGSTVMITVV